jgi:molybdate transport system permease protein
MTKNPLRWLGALLVLYLGLPIALFVIRFVSARERGFHVAGLFSSLWISISCASVSLVVICVFGTPLAYVLARSTSRLARLVEIAITLPLALPPVMGGIIVVYLVGPYSSLGRLFDRQLTNSVYGICIAMTFCSAPFLILAARAAFASIDQGLLDVASTLGHSEMSRFFRVAVPVAGPGIRAGMTMTWLRAFGEYGAVTILAYNPASLPVYTVNQFMARGIAPTLAPTMLALIVASGIVLLSRARLPKLAHVDLSEITPVPPTLKPSSRLRFDISKQLGSFQLKIKHVTQSDNLAVLGPSGSGKSALLRSLAGLYGPGAGEVSYGNDVVSNVKPEKRPVGYVSQGFSLFPHLTVWQNLNFPKNATRGNAAYWLGHLQLDGLENRYPSEISGGQRQRVALAQALCHSPEVLLLDEPFSALDMPIRRELHRELRRLQQETGLATVIVTHDPQEAAFLSQEVIVITDGASLQSGTNRQVFSRPASPEVARLLGISNLHHALVVAPGRIDSGGTVIAVDTDGMAPGAEVLWSIRPEQVIVRTLDDRASFDPADEGLVGTLSDIADVGTAVDLFVTLNDQFELHARVVDPVELSVGQRCRVVMDRSAISLWANPNVPLAAASTKGPAAQ